MIEIKMKINNGDWLVGLEKYIAKNNLGDIKELVEMELTTFQLGTVSLYFYFGQFFSGYEFNFEGIQSTDVIELVIIKNGSVIFGGYVDNRSIVYDKKNYILSLNAFSYRYILRIFDGEEVYDRMYVDNMLVQYKVWYRFMSVKMLVNKIYDQIDEYISDKYVSDLMHICNFANPDSFLTFNCKYEMALRNISYVRDILPTPDDPNVLAIYVYGGGYYKGDFLNGFRYIYHYWSEPDGGGVKMPVDWRQQNLTTVNKVFGRRIPNAGEGVHWYHSEFDYANNREFAVGIKSEGNHYWNEIYTAIRIWSGSAWTAWVVTRVVPLAWDEESPIMFPNFCTWLNPDSNTHRYIVMFRHVNGQVVVMTFNSSGVFTSTVYQTNFGGGYLPVSEPFTPPENNIWHAGQHRSIWHDVKKIGHYMYMYVRELNKVVIFDMNTHVFYKYDFNDLYDGALWNLNSLKYDSNHPFINSWSFILTSDHKIKLLRGIPFRSQIQCETELIQLDWGNTKFDNPDDYNPVEIGFDWWNGGINHHIGWRENVWRGFFDSVKISQAAEIPAVLGPRLLASIRFNEFGNGCQFLTHDVFNETVIVDADFSNKSSSDVLKDLATAACAVEHIDKDKKAHFINRQELFAEIYHFNTGAHTEPDTNHNYCSINDEDQSLLNFDSNDSFTIECLCRIFQTGGSEDHFLVGKRQLVGAGPFYTIVVTQAGILQARLHDGNDQITANSIGLNVFDHQDVMYYIALVVDRSTNTMRLRFKDSWVSSATDISVIGDLTNDGPFHLGKNFLGAFDSDAWGGIIRELKISKGVRSENELMANYNELNGWVPDGDGIAIGHWNFNTQSGKDLTINRNFFRLKSVVVTPPAEQFFIKSGMYGLTEIKKYLKESNRQYLWEYHCDGVKINYGTAGKYIEMGETRVGAKVFETAVPYITKSISASIIAKAYYSLFNQKRHALEVEFVNFYPKLFNFYKVDDVNYININVTNRIRNDTSKAIFVEVD